MNKEKPMNKILNKRMMFDLSQTLLRVVLIVVSCGGLCAVIAVMYRVPVKSWTAFETGFRFSLIFSLLFLLIKRRYVIFACVAGIPLWAVSNPQKFTKIVRSFSSLTDLFWLRIDGQYISSARFAGHDKDALDAITKAFKNGTDTLSSSNVNFGNEILAAFTVVCIVLALIFALTVQENSVGVILLTVFIIICPAVFAGIAVYTNFVIPLVSGMFALYVLYISQSYEPNRRIKSAVFGGLPKLKRNWSGALLITLTAAAAFSFTSSYFTEERTAEFEDNFNKLVNAVSNMNKTKPSENDSKGYMPEENADYLSLNTPSSDSVPVLRVITENNDRTLYLRAGIALSLDALNFRMMRTPQSDTEKDLVNQLYAVTNAGFYPEMIFPIYKTELELLLPEYQNSAAEFQNITIEYLVDTKTLLIPTVTALTNYRDDNRFNASLDSVMLSDRNLRNKAFSWNVLVPNKDGNFSQARKEVERDITKEFSYTEAKEKGLTGSLKGDDSTLCIENIYDTFILPVYTGKLTVSEFLALKEKYGEIVQKLYTITSPGETTAIKRITDEITEWSFGKNFPGYADCVEEFFRSNFTYSLSVDNTQGGFNTILDNFMFSTRSGHCAMYAAAMTEILRTAGIPARYVTGYAVDETKGKNYADGGYIQTVASRDLHAWVEVYYKETGWIPYDPTPSISDEVYNAGQTAGTTDGQSAANSVQSEVSETAETSSASITSVETTAEPDESEITETTVSQVETNSPKPINTEQNHNLAIFIICSALAVFVFCGVTAVFIIPLNTEKKVLRKIMRAGNSGELKYCYSIVLKLLQLEKLQPENGETPAIFAVRTDETGQYNLSEIIQTFERLEFSGAELEPAQSEQIIKFTVRLYRKIVTEQKLFIKIARRISVSEWKI